MSYEIICPKCNGKNSKSSDTCICVENRIAKKGCMACKGTGKGPCITCNGTGKIYVPNKP